MPPKQQLKNDNTKISSLSLDNLKKMLNTNDFSGFRNLIIGNYNNPAWKNSFNYKTTQPTISFVGGILLQDVIMNIFGSMKKGMFDEKRLDYFKSPVFVENFIKEIKHVTKVSDVKPNEEDSLEYGKWILDVFNTCFKVRDVYGGGSAGDECKRVLWKNSSKEEYMLRTETECYICQRPWLGTTTDGKHTCINPATLDPTHPITFDPNYVHCEHIVPFLAALYHVKLARPGDSLDDPILDTQYALAHKGCNELKADYQMYMKVSKSTKISGTSIGGSNISDIQDGGDGVVTRSRAKAVIVNDVAPDRLMDKVKKLEKKQKPKQPVQPEKQSDIYDEPEFNDLASEFKFMYVPNMDMIDTLYFAIVNARHQHWGVDKNNNPIKFNANSVLLNTMCTDIHENYNTWNGKKSYPILPRLTGVLKYINTNIDNLRTNNSPDEQVELLYDLWGKFKLIFAISPQKLDQIFLRGEIEKKVEKKSKEQGGGSIQVGGEVEIKSDYTIMTDLLAESVKEILGEEKEKVVELYIPLRITGRFKLIMGSTERNLDANKTYYKFTITDRPGYTGNAPDNSMDAPVSDAVPSVRTSDRISKFVNGTYQYTYDTTNNLKYLQKVVNADKKPVILGEPLFIMKDPTDPLYAVEYVNFGEISSTDGNKNFGVYTVFSKDIMGRSLNGGSRGGGDDDVSSDSGGDGDSDGDDNEGNVRYANFRTSKTRRIKHNHDKTLSDHRKTFKKR
jgi:hypothetical protein